MRKLYKKIPDLAYHFDADPDPMRIPRLQNEPPWLQDEPPRLQGEPPQLPAFHYDADPDLAFDFDANPDPVVTLITIRRNRLPKNDADPNPQHVQINMRSPSPSSNFRM